MSINRLFSAKHFYLISYDIVEDRPRLRLMKLLKSHGFHVQKSVFECILTPSQFQNLQKKIEKLIDAETDSVRIYRLCQECKDQVKIMGRGDVSEIPLVMVI